MAAALAAGPVVGEAAAPRVAADIAPVASLAARVMAGVGAPTTILPPGASPHGYAMRPSEAAALQAADVVFWVGPGLAPWFGEALEKLAPGAVAVSLRDAPGVILLPVREGATFARHDHGDARDHGDAHDHDDHAAHGHEAEAQEAHDHGANGDAAAGQGAHADDDHDHGEGAMDEHLWLDPANARAWAAAMAATLSAADPANAAAYAANAAALSAELTALEAELAAELAPAAGKPFVVFHDAYQYFERRFGLSAAGAIALGDATAPGAARVRAVRDQVRALGVTCVLSEPQFSPALVATVTEGSGARTATLDPLGAKLAPGPDLYPELLRAMAASLRGCLGA